MADNFDVPPSHMVPYLIFMCSIPFSLLNARHRNTGLRVRRLRFESHLCDCSAVSRSFPVTAAPDTFGGSVAPCSCWIHRETAGAPGDGSSQFPSAVRFTKHAPGQPKDRLCPAWQSPRSRSL